MSDDKENNAATTIKGQHATLDARNTVPHTTSAAAAAAKPITTADTTHATHTNEHSREPPSSMLRAMAKCNSAHGNAVPANINDSVISKCSLCNRTETGFEQYIIPMSRTDHCTPENDNADDKARHATPTAEMHRTILDASTASHTKPTIAKKKLRIKRGSHPAARRQRKRIAAARAAAAASESPPRLEETKSEQYNLPRRSLDHYRTVTTTVR